MARMGDVWDRTTQVLGGRTAMIAPIATLAIFLPAVVNAAIAAYGTKGTMGFALGSGAVAIVAMLASVWAQLVIIGIASDPVTSREEAIRAAGRRLWPVIGIGIVLALVLGIALLPAIGALAASGVDLSAMTTGQPVALGDVSGGGVVFAVLYFVVYALALLFVFARLAVLNPVVLHERLGLGAIGRSIALTRGHMWRIVGVLLLFIVVLLVATWAAQLIVGLPLRLMLGADGIATAAFVAAVAGAAVSTVFSVIAAVFVAQLYIALRGSPASA